MPNPTPITALAYDASLDALWAANANGLYRYSRSGTLQYQLSLKGIQHLAGDRQGGLWATTAKRLYSIDASGLVRFDLDPFFQRGGGAIVALVADPGDRTAWVANQHAIVQVGLDGGIRHSLDFGQGAISGRIWALGLYADTTPPQLAFTHPPAGPTSTTTVRCSN